MGRLSVNPDVFFKSFGISDKFWKSIDLVIIVGCIVGAVLWNISRKLIESNL